MKFISFIAVLVLGSFAHAQSVDVKGIDPNTEGSTTIRIEKNKNSEMPSTPGTKPTWEVSEGTADVEGEASATAKDAKAAWKKACDAWKKEFREDNKENKILNMNCGVSDCSGDAGNKICTSKATYKIKTKIDQ